MKPTEIRGSQWWRYNLFFTLQHFLGYKRFIKYFGKQKEQLDEEILRSRGDSEALPVREVTRVDRNTSFEDFKKICDRPLVFPKVAEDWTCTRDWSFDFFKRTYGDTEVMLNDNIGLVDKDRPQEFAKLKLADYIESLENGSTTTYLKFARDIFEDNPKMKEDLDLAWLRRMRLPSSFSREEVLMFMSNAGTLTPTHAGVSGNFFIQVMGKKTWTLWEPGDRIYLDSRTERTFYYFSHVDPNRDDPSLPLAKFATTSQVTLEPGDILWVPPFFWHHVYNPTPSIGVTYRVMSLPAAFKGSTLLMSLIFFATRPNPFYHLYMSTFHKKTAIFQKKFDDL